jgi:bacillithiol system protein YtxJ
MQGWHQLDSEELLADLHQNSFDNPIVIFKHSTRCSISSMAWNRIVHLSQIDKIPARFYHLDLVRNRNVSAAIAENFAVYHESPQVLVIRQGECTYEASHMEIRPDEILEALN